MAHLETHADPHYGHYRRAVVGFEIHNPNLTYFGRPLQLPGAGGAAVSVAGAPARKTRRVARRGETLACIASLYNVPVQELRTASTLFNRAALLGCEPNGDSTQVRGAVRLNRQPISGCRVVFSWQPDGDVVAARVTGAGAPPGQYTHILEGRPPRAGSSWFWIESKDGTRLSVAGDATDAWTIIFYANRDLTGAPVLQRQDASIRFDWQAGQPGSTVASDDFIAAWDDHPPLSGRLLPQSARIA